MSLGQVKENVRARFADRAMTNSELWETRDEFVRLTSGECAEGIRWYAQEYGNVFVTDLKNEIAGLKLDPRDGAKMLLEVFERIDGIRNGGHCDGYIDKADLAVFIERGAISILEQRAAQIGLDHYNEWCQGGEHALLIEKADLREAAGSPPVVESYRDALKFFSRKGGEIFNQADGVRNGGYCDGYIDAADLAVYIDRSGDASAKKAAQLILDHYNELAPGGNHPALIELADIKRALQG